MKLTIAGDPLSVSTGIENSFGITPTRIGGVDRYDTSVKLNRAAFTTATTVYLATGERFPDALSGAAAAGFTKNPLYTVNPTACRSPCSTTSRPSAPRRSCYSAAPAPCRKGSRS